MPIVTECMHATFPWRFCAVQLRCYGPFTHRQVLCDECATAAGFHVETPEEEAAAIAEVEANIADEAP